MNKITNQNVSIKNAPEISAIYFALLQCGYDSFGNDAKLTKIIKSFSSPSDNFSFFKGVKQNSCEIYPYWPRASMLETASFYMNPNHTEFENFDAFKHTVMSASNIVDSERDDLFWEWIKDFPHALNEVIISDSFCDYIKWENKWINRQNSIKNNELQVVEKYLDICEKKYNSPLHNISIILSPIKCAYSADYHTIKNQFTYCSGTFDSKSVIHEFLHHLAHPIVESNKIAIMCSKVKYTDIDNSYYLNGNEIGQLNAFEEYFVRILTDAILTKNPPDNLDVLIKELL